MKVEAQIPGKIMLAGEYAVLHGGRACAGTLNRHLHVWANFEPGAAGKGGVVCSSDLWDNPRTIEELDSFDELPEDPFTETVRAGMKDFGIRAGAVRVRSNLSLNYGVGSSSALRLGVLLAMARASGKAKLDIYGATHKDYSTTTWEIARQAFALQKNHQKLGSGYDIATQLLGGIVLMEPAVEDSIDLWPGRLTRLGPECLEPLDRYVHVFVGGNGAPTAPTAKETATWFMTSGNLPKFMTASEDLIDALLGLIRDSHPFDGRLLQAVAKHRRILEYSPSFPQQVGKTLQNVAGCDENWSYKTTGAGGEDALLLFGEESSIQNARKALEQLGWFRLSSPFACQGAEVKSTFGEG